MALLEATVVVVFVVDFVVVIVDIVVVVVNVAVVVLLVVADQSHSNVIHTRFEVFL